MLSQDNPLLLNTRGQTRHPFHCAETPVLRTARRLYERARRRAWCRRVWAAVTCRTGKLIPLSDLRERCQVGARCYAGIKTVPLWQIRGTAGRHADFDDAFHPLHDRNRDRWLGVAAAYLRGAALPPIELVRVGDSYFVLDGHHRVSVARALGQQDIEAEVTIYGVGRAASTEGWALAPVRSI